MNRQLSLAVFTGLALIASTSLGAIASADTREGCREIKLNGKTQTLCPGQKVQLGSGLKKTTSQIRSSGSALIARPISVSASAQMEVSADQITLNFRFNGTGKNMAEAIAELQKKKKDIAEVAKTAGMQVNKIDISRLNVNLRNRGTDSNYNGNATFAVSIANFGDPLDAIAKLSDLNPQGVNQLNFSMSDEGLKKAEAELEKQAKENARKQAERQAANRGVKLGEMTSFDFKANTRPRRNRQQNFTLSGHGRATFAIAK